MAVVLETQQFETLHKIKQTRFHSAQKTLVEKKDFLAQAEQIVNQAREARVEFADYRQQQKTKLYEEEINRGGDKLNKISNVNYELQLLKQRLLEFQQEENKAAQQLAAAQLELNQARESLIQSQRALSKYDELGLDVKIEQAKRSEQIQDKEFEDFQYKSQLS